MLTQGEDVEVHALARRGWSISAIARHLDRDRKTVRGYLRGTRKPGVRASAAPDPLAPFAVYVSARFADDPHIWASALFDEVVPLGYRLSYVSFARQLRLAGLRPHCEACSGVSGRDTIEIAHCSPPPAGPAPGAFGPRRSTRHLARTACTLHTAGSRTRHPGGHHQLKVFKKRSETATPRRIGATLFA
jgi:hypothetical protein